MAEVPQPPPPLSAGGRQRIPRKELFVPSTLVRKIATAVLATIVAAIGRHIERRRRPSDNARR
jgi:hypothetical protein